MAIAVLSRKKPARRKKRKAVCTPVKHQPKGVVKKKKAPVCTPVGKKKAPVKAKAPVSPATGGMHPSVPRTGGKPPAPVKAPTAAPTPTPTPAAQPDLPPARGPVAIPAYTGPVHAGAFGAGEAERLLWRAGFGPAPGDAVRLAALGLEGAVRSLTRPAGTATLTGPAPTYVKNGVAQPILPFAAYGHEHLAWLDRMIRSDQPLVERMALIWHDWFAVTNDAVGSQRQMIDQTDLFRASGLGNFETLLLEVTRDPAMLLFLDGTSNRKGAINENYGREVMELFCLGADRGAYTEGDVRELARAFSGWRADWSAELGNNNFRWDRARWDDKPKTVFGRTGNFAWESACRLLVEHPLHASWAVGRLWRAFVPGEPPAATAAALERLYVDSGLEVAPVVEAILMSPELYGDRAMVKPPVVALAGMLRARGRGITSDRWWYLSADAGQRLYYPPDVAGWRDDAWLDTSTLRGRWYLTYNVLEGQTVPVSNAYPVETPQQAVAAALAFWGNPPLRAETVQALESWAGTALGITNTASRRAQRQNALRQLVGTSPDYLTS